MLRNIEGNAGQDIIRIDRYIKEDDKNIYYNI
jgi:hypothetical protein